MTGLDRPNPPVPGKVTHHSAELFWKVPKSKDVRISVLIQLCAPNEEDYETIYTLVLKYWSMIYFLHTIYQEINKNVSIFKSTLPVQ